MQRQETPISFDQRHASEYDQRFAKLAPLRDAMNLIIGALFADLPREARILCVGAGTGNELLYLAGKFPGWSFTAVDPSGPMLAVCRNRAQELGFASRCSFHEGYLESLPATEPFDAATSILVSQFLLDPESRAGFFRAISGRLKPGGQLASADLASDTASEDYQNLFSVWAKLMRVADIADDRIEAMKAAYARDVAVWPVEKVAALIHSAGFTLPVLFLQTGLIHAWHAVRQSGDQPPG